MDSSEILKVIKKDFRQTEAWANFLAQKGFKPLKLKNNSYIHEFSLGNITILKSFRPELDEASLKEIQNIADRKINLLCKISPNFGFEEKLNDKYGYITVSGTMSATKTCIVDLTRNFDDICKDFSENTRYKINRSIREKDRIEIIQNPTNKNIDLFYDLLQVRQIQKKFISFSRKEIRSLSNLFWNNSYLISAYDKENKPVVSNLYFVNEGKVTYFAGSLNQENHKSKAGYQLIFEAFKHFKELGIKVYDFEGIKDERNKYTTDWDGLTNFKLKFGKTILTYPINIIKYNNFYLRQMVKIFGID
jgi:lipid II:glycine glycyltransferase (peptidoglycan interpeptide bridge formation enzyme)